LYNKISGNVQKHCLRDLGGIELKHPALTRLFAAVLAVLCLTMLLAGLGSVRGALSDRKKTREEHQRLPDRIGEYRAVLDTLSGREGYREADSALKKAQAAHDEQASQHRMDLAIYTATRSGIRSGKLALYQAETALTEGRAQCEEGRKQFEEQARKYVVFPAGLVYSAIIRHLSYTLPINIPPLRYVFLYRNSQSYINCHAICARANPYGLLPHRRLSQRG
jgi:hypothetical protein